MRPSFLHNNNNINEQKQRDQSSEQFNSSSSSNYFKQKIVNNGGGQQEGGGGKGGQQQGTPPPSVVLFLDECGNNINIQNDKVINEIRTNTIQQINNKYSNNLLTRNPSVDIHSPEREPLISVQRIISTTNNNSFSSRSPSATSLTSTGGSCLLINTTNSHHCSPNPSPPPSQISPSSSVVIQSNGKYGTVNSTRVLQNSSSGSISVARMMSSLLKQQNSIAEEEPENLSFEEKEEKQQQQENLIQQNLQQIIENNTILQKQKIKQQKCWLAPPEHTIIGGNISPPPSRIHPLQDLEMRKELNEHISISEQQKQQQQQQFSHYNISNEIGKHLVTLATPIATGAASPNFAVHHHYQQQQSTKSDSKSWHRQQSQPWSARGATSKHRKGSLSPNNSLRYSTLMAAAARRNNFQQQRTTSEATPAQRDQLMSDVLGHGIRDQYVCASVSAPSPRLVASTIATDQLCENNIINTDSHHSSCCSSSIPSHHSRRCPLRFELGGGDSSASSLNGGGGMNAQADQCCSQCSSANSLHRAGSIRQRCVPRGRLNTVDRCSGAENVNVVPGNGGGSGSLPRLVTLIPSAFPPASIMLSNDISPQQSPSSQQLHHNQLTQLLQQQKTYDQRTRTQSGGGGKRRRTEDDKALIHPPLLPQKPISDSFGSIGSNKIAPISPPFSSPQSITLFPPNVFNTKRKGDPTRFNFAATKQRSSSEMTFSNIPKLKLLPGSNDSTSNQQLIEGCQCCKHLNDLKQQRSSFCQESPCLNAGMLFKNKNLSQISSNNFSTMRRPESMSALGNSHSEHRRSSSMALVHQERQQAILQRILGPTGLGWLKNRDPLLKKSLSLIFNDGDIESQRPGAVSAIGVFGAGPPGPPSNNNERGGCQGSVLDESINCSIKQPLVKEKERGGRFIKRQLLFNKRRITSDYALFFALFGIILMIIENEFAYLHYFMICTVLKIIILISTIILVGLVVKYHVHEIQLFMNANSAEDWQIALTCRKSMQIIIEVVACAICPLPIQLNGDLWPTIPKHTMPLDVFFSILMFFRLYWLCRVMLLHSRLFTDAASRSIAGLNRVKTDAKFILKTLMTICPGTVLMLFTASLWMIGGYILRLCERHNNIGDSTMSVHAEKHQNYLNSLWLVAVTFLSIGYGDIVPNTQCGRIMAVVTGILGTCTSSMVVAVIARKLELTRAEKHVHNFMIETQHTKEMKHIAANVLRETWLIYKNRRLVDKIEPSRIRYHQRKFLVAICALRKLKTSQRKLEENRVSLGDVAKTTAHSHDLMRDVHTTQEGMALRITAVEHQLSDIQRELSSLSELLRFALRPQIEYQHYDQNQQEQLQASLIKLSTNNTQPNGQQNIIEPRQRRKPSALSET